MVALAKGWVEYVIFEKVIDVKGALIAAGRAANVSAFVKHAVNLALYDAADWADTWRTPCGKQVAP